MLNWIFSGRLAAAVRAMGSGWEPAYFRISTSLCKSYHLVAFVATKYLIIPPGDRGRGVAFVTASGTPKAKPAPSEEPGLEPPDSIDADPVGHRLQEDLFQSLVESADYTDRRTPLPARSGAALQPATPAAIREAVAAQSNVLSHSLRPGVDSDNGIQRVPDLVMYGIPDAGAPEVRRPFPDGLRGRVVPRSRRPGRPRATAADRCRGEAHEARHLGRMDSHPDAKGRLRLFAERHGPQQLEFQRIRRDGRGHVSREAPP